MTQRLHFWADVLAKFAVPFLVAILMLMWSSSEKHSADMESRMNGIEHTLNETQVTLAKLSTEMSTSVTDRFSNEDRRLQVLEAHQDKVDDRLNQIGPRK